ncbi:hypothetical protein ABB37_02172 [Leptomonas pyrrhocoris]|uniref:AB hydrolase-1 domain-containing protein n=1 Tax=Leptomonas pyrrhocoris TaxID=157538 RepID=A0A0N0VH00_LEPPY|nr:hypothetical protein ABB37_02172 [Leptomonas pyrrhocoris]XP_015662484.1 hypothetical protein ABB37_02172 [Leptomonas pyrrhocoris]KPA84044.1 hypothetical protein ABB37_02172 [Leptomonas pyrrhocoris]KPA84045.1 hypothetical protein ABB37_02172 [Leptomonas pyrrhocoris]|eukprot:XP_015662483.1 hypothetical protein ABB37_02172 [Leptomonas pyrrhocoris]
MKRLSHRIYTPAAEPRILSGTGVLQRATPSPVHLVFMHGLMGTHRNFASVCAAMSGAQDEKSRMADLKMEEVRRVTVPSDCDEAAGCCAHPGTAGAPRVYQCVAFDWRNHGDSEHNPNMTLDGLAEDVTDFLADYGTAVLAAPSPVPLILVAHSMGALGLMHWMWTEHLRQWRDRVLANGLGPLRPSQSAAATSQRSLFATPAYRVLGAVLIDTAPAERPASFYDTTRLIRSLSSVPLGTLHSRTAVEGWMQQHGPRDLCTPDKIWLLRYQLSNLTFPKGAAPTWRIGLEEIINGLDRISWSSGSVARDAIVREVERLAVSRGLPTPAPPPLDEFPVSCVFGATSPYDTAATRAAVRRIFKAPSILEMEDAGHFLFMWQKRTFVSTLRDVCYALEKAGGMLRGMA